MNDDGYPVKKNSLKDFKHQDKGHCCTYWWQLQSGIKCVDKVLEVTWDSCTVRHWPGISHLVIQCSQDSEIHVRDGAAEVQLPGVAQLESGRTEIWPLRLASGHSYSPCHIRLFFKTLYVLESLVRNMKCSQTWNLLSPKTTLLYNTRKISKLISCDGSQSK